MNKKIGLLLCLSVVTLLLSWFIYPMTIFWNWVDHQTFWLLNNLLKDNFFLQKLTAFMNSRYGDWIIETVIISLYVGYAIFTKNNTKLKQLLTLLVTAISTQLLINKMLFFKLFKIIRESPSMQFSGFVDLSHFNYFNHRVETIHSYPADHATTLLFCAFFAWQHFEKKVASGVSLLCFFFILPRLACGAHWMTDIIMGALPITLLGFWLSTIATQQRDCDTLK